MSEALAVMPQRTGFLQIVPAQTVFSAGLFENFIDYTSVKETTIKGYITCIRAFARWMRESGITQPTRADIKAYERYLASSDYKPGTQAQYLRAVKHFFKWTAAEGLYPNIADNIKGVKVRNDTHKKDALPLDNLPAIAETIKRDTEQGKRLYALYLLCIADGLRTIEISRANIGDIKTIGGRTYLYVQGKGHDEKDAPVLLPPEVKTALDEYLATRTDTPTAKSPLFVSTSNRSKGKRIAPTTISTMMKNMLRAAGFDSDRLTAHSLRHTSITIACKIAGLQEAQKLARHVDPATTEIYAHVLEREERDTENLVYNYAFHRENISTSQQEAIAIINRLPANKLELALTMLKTL